MTLTKGEWPFNPFCTQCILNLSKQVPLSITNRSFQSFSLSLQTSFTELWVMMLMDAHRVTQQMDKMWRGNIEMFKFYNLSFHRHNPPPTPIPPKKTNFPSSTQNTEDVKNSIDDYISDKIVIANSGIWKSVGGKRRFWWVFISFFTSETFFFLLMQKCFFKVSFTSSKYLFRPLHK